MYSLTELTQEIEREECGNLVDTSLFRIVRFLPHKYMGHGADAVAYMAGKDLGKYLNLSSVEDVLDFCKNNGIGIGEVVSESPLQIRVDECITCSGLPEVGYPLCYFEGGFLSGCLENILNKSVDLKEIKCAGLGDDFCMFEMIQR